jgi:3-oxoacyl-[acyl-carrier-protein] synthase-3
VSKARIGSVNVAGVATCVPPAIRDNMDAAATHGETEVRKVVNMAGVRFRRVVADGVCTSDLCFEAATRLLVRLGWPPESITGLIMVTQSPDYLLPSTASLLHKWLGLGAHCAAFDVGLGCSGYPYALYLASCMLAAGGQQRILVLQGDIPSRFTAEDDRATAMLFGDAGSATGLEHRQGAAPSFFNLQSDGAGHDQLIIRGGGFRDRFPRDARDNYVRMDGAAVFKFTIERVPPLVAETLEQSGSATEDIDYFVFHQSNQFIMRHVAGKCGLPPDRVPLNLEKYGNTGGASVPLCLTTGMPGAFGSKDVRLMLLGYGVGLSWGAAVMTFAKDVVVEHVEYSGELARA